MRLLKHPIRAIREPFGTAGLIVACVALVAALAGGAYAAKGGLTGKQKKEVKKIARQYAGKPGANGAPGAAGAQGPAGGKGDKGDKGSAGAAGPAGKPVTVGTATIAQCEEGGVTVGVEGGAATPICNGEEGPPGPEGVCSTSSCHLPTGVTETGTWSFGTLATGVALMRLPLSFSIPLSGNLSAANVHFINTAGKEVTEAGDEVTSTTCLGTALAPSATSGNLCVYAKTLTGMSTTTTSGAINKGGGAQGGVGATPAGAFLAINGPEANAAGSGTWAVTG